MQAMPVQRLRSVQPDNNASGQPNLAGTQLVQQMAAVHATRTACGATPSHYVALVELFCKLFTRKQAQLMEQQSFLKVLLQNGVLP